MSTQRVVFDDKETFQTSPLDEINKATAANYNELKDVINFNAQALDDILSITTGDVSAIQNTFTSDITAQTGTNTFALFDSDIDVTGRTSTGEVNFLEFKKTDTGTTSVFSVDLDGFITSASDTDASTILGRGIIDSRTTDIIHFSHIDRQGVSEFALAQTADGVTRLNCASSAEIQFRVGGSNRWKLLSTGDLEALAGNHLNLSTTSEIQAGGVAAITFTATQDVTIPNGKFNTTTSTTLAAINIGSFAGDPSALVNFDLWGNSSTNKLRARENGASVDVITSADPGAVKTTGVITISSADLLAINTTPKEIIPAQGADTVIIIMGLFITYLGGATGYAVDTSIKLYFNNGAQAVLSPISIAGTSDTFTRADRLSGVFGGTTNNFTNQNIVLSTDTSDPTTGDGTMEVIIDYIVMSV